MLIVLIPSCFYLATDDDKNKLCYKNTCYLTSNKSNLLPHPLFIIFLKGLSGCQVVVQNVSNAAKKENDEIGNGKVLKTKTR